MPPPHATGPQAPAPEAPPDSASTAPQASPTALRLPEAPLLVAGLGRAAWLTNEGELALIEAGEALRRAREVPPILCHAPATARRLGADPFPAFDVLELLAFVRPAVFCPPTPAGLAALLGLPPPTGLEPAATTLHQVMGLLLRELAARGPHNDPYAGGIAWTLAQAGWRWGPAVLAAVGLEGANASDKRRPLDVWLRLPEWSDGPGEPPPGNQPVSAQEARRRLAALLGEDAEPRPQQADYASAVTQAFQPRDEPDGPALVLAEAGTGVGKTLGYIAPASLWAEKNKGPVWLSTYTRNLQHQIDGELDRLFPELAEKRRRVVIRKGRENYLCLLNFEEAVKGLGSRPGDALATGLMARWAARTRDGDMVGGDFPGWLPDLVGRARSLGLTDRRGECIHSACQHYGRCFIERSIRRARRAELVVANHALVMIQAAMGAEEGQLPLRYVFDEGHHLFDAADGAFAAHLSGQETHELRRWLLGAERRSASARQIRGLKRRIEDLIAADEEAQEALEEVLRAARGLTSEGWLARLGSGAAQGPAEAFLALVREQTYVRARNSDSPYGLECDVKPPLPGLLEAAERLDQAFARLRAPLRALEKRLAARLDEDADALDSETRRRIEAARRGLERRALMPLVAWRGMLSALEEETPADFVDWFQVERLGGHDSDVGFYRHWIDPTKPFAAAVLEQAHGVVVTSATLTDGSDDADTNWAGAEMRSGAVHLARPAIRARVPSPFDYAAQTRVFIVTDVRKDALDQVAAAYRALFLAAGGGGLGLFTAIARLRAVHGRIAGALDAAGIPLYAQHVDRLDTATLVEIFRAEERSCLLGTDAVRDGVDVPGRALRLIVFDRVPWPRPDIRHRARREAFGGRAYDDRLTRLKLKQGFGRLIRRADDQGVFV
ncbi:MAG: ATP-dependent DNA helicase, partial [Kiloniellales bacterium]